VGWQFINNLLHNIFPQEQKQKETIGMIYPEWITDLPKSYQLETMSNYSILKKYTIKPYKGNVTAFFSNSIIDSHKNAIDYSQYMGWEKYIDGKVDTYIIPGEHTTMILPPNVKEMAHVVDEYLGKVGRNIH
jgi:thioesterase domain-containing protein